MPEIVDDKLARVEPQHWFQALVLPKQRVEVDEVFSGAALRDGRHLSSHDSLCSDFSHALTILCGNGRISSQKRSRRLSNPRPWCCSSHARSASLPIFRRSHCTAFQSPSARIRWMIKSRWQFHLSRLNPVSQKKGLRNDGKEAGRMWELAVFIIQARK